MFNTLDHTDESMFFSPSEMEEMLPSDPMGWNDETADQFARDMGW